MVATMTAQLDGLILSDDPSGTDPAFKLMTLDGWYSAPPIETSIDSIPLADGGFDAPSFRRPKKVSINGVVTASSVAVARGAAWRTLTGISPTGGQMTLTFTDENGPLSMKVRLDGAPQVIPYGRVAAFFQIPLVAPDPRKYGPRRTVTVNPYAAATDGLAFPLFAPGYLDFGAFSTVGLAGAQNTGTAPSWPTFTVTGGIDAAGFTVVGTDGSVATYAAAVTSGTSVVLSPYAGGRATIGASDVTANLTASQWAPIAPGAAVSYALYPIGTADATASLAVSYSEAWW